jgi:hypothetical protein
LAQQALGLRQGEICAAEDDNILVGLVHLVQDRQVSLAQRQRTGQQYKLQGEILY